jgi:hypothetical protein
MHWHRLTEQRDSFFPSFMFFWHALVLGKTLAQNRNVFWIYLFPRRDICQSKTAEQDLKKFARQNKNSLKAKDSKENEARQPFLFFYLELTD